jgi:hypothetical protein
VPGDKHVTESTLPKFLADLEILFLPFAGYLWLFLPSIRCCARCRLIRRFVLILGKSPSGITRLHRFIFRRLVFRGGGLIRVHWFRIVVCRSVAYVLQWIVIAGIRWSGVG